MLACSFEGKKRGRKTIGKGEAEKVGRGKERERKACRIDRKKEGEGGEAKT